MKKVLLSIALALALAVPARAQESELSGGGGGGVATAGGSGTANTVAKFNSASTIADSLLTSTTNVTLTSGQFFVPNGTAGAPSYSFTTADTNDTGFFRAGTDQIGISAGGTERARLTTAGLDIGANSLTFGSAVGTNESTLLREASNAIALRNSTNAQNVRIYQTFTDGSNYGRWVIGDIGTISGFGGRRGIAYELAGTGTDLALEIGTRNNNSINFFTNATFNWSIGTGGTLSPFADAGASLGATTARVNDIFSVSYNAATANGALASIKTISESLTLSTAGATTDTTANLLPADAIILMVTWRITTTIAGIDSTSVQFGDATTAARFGSGTVFTAGTVGRGYTQWNGNITTTATGPTQAAAAKLRVTLAGGADNTPSGGVVRITVTYIDATPPTS